MCGLWPYLKFKKHEAFTNESFQFVREEFILLTVSGGVMEYKENHTVTKISASVEVNDGLVNQRTYQISIEATPQTHTY